MEAQLWALSLRCGVRELRWGFGSSGVGRSGGAGAAVADGYEVVADGGEGLLVDAFDGEAGVGDQLRSPAPGCPSLVR